MKHFIVLACVLVGVIAGGKYTDKYDNINLKEVLHNERLLKGYTDCVLDKGKCTPEGNALKENLEDAIATGCEKCTEKQENGAAEVIEFLIEHKPDIWEELCARFDSTGKYRKQYEDRAKAKGIKIPPPK